MAQTFLGIVGGQVTEVAETGVTSVTGTAPVVSSGTSTPAISMAKATAAVDGYLAAADFTTFNSKQAAIGNSLQLGAAGAKATLTMATGTAGDWSQIIMRASNTQTAWSISASNTTSGALEFAASTAGGGTTWATPRFILSSSGMGFQGTAPIAKPTITGSRAGSAALASLLTALASYGLITDSTTA